MAVHTLHQSGFERVEDDASASKVLAPIYYTDPRAFEIEKREVFRKSWLFAGHESQIAMPGDHLPVRVGGQPLVLLRDRDGCVRAFFNVCAHRGMTVVHRPGCSKTLKCPYHGWVYDLTGRLVAARNTAQMESFETAPYALKEVRVELHQGLVFVNLDADARDLAQTIGPIFDDIADLGLEPAKFRLGKVVDYPLNTNWKIAIDNFVECYHCPVAHPGIEQFFEYEKTFAKVVDWGVIAGGPPDAETLAHYRRECEAHGWPLVAETRYSWAWPNIMYLIGWSPRPHLMLWTIEPETHDRMVFRHNYFFYDEAPDTEQLAFIQAIDKVQREDNPILEGVWEGMNSLGFEGQGTYVINDADTYQTERGVWQFHWQLQQIYDRAGM